MYNGGYNSMFLALIRGKIRSALICEVTLKIYNDILKKNKNYGFYLFIKCIDEIIVIYE